MGPRSCNRIKVSSDHSGIALLASPPSCDDSAVIDVLNQVLDVGAHSAGINGHRGWGMNRNQAQIWLYSEGGVGHCHAGRSNLWGNASSAVLSSFAVNANVVGDTWQLGLKIIRYSGEVGDVADPLFDLHDGIHILGGEKLLKLIGLATEGIDIGDQDSKSWR